MTGSKDSDCVNGDHNPNLVTGRSLTIEVFGEFLGLDTDQGLYTYFRRHWGDWFPVLLCIDRTTFARQAANLCHVKARLWEYLLSQLAFDPAFSLVDSFPMPVCRFARAYRCKRLTGWAAFGYDEMAKQTFYGLRAHLRVCWPGVIVGWHLTPANIHDLEVAESLLEGARGWALGDRNYWSPQLTERLRRQGLCLPASYKSAKRDRQPWPHWLVQSRRRIETLIGQLVERYRAKTVWARDAWHLYLRWLRKVLSHTFTVLLCQQIELPLLRFAELIID